MCALHANRVTCMKKDMLLARRIRGDAMRDHRDTMPKGNETFYSLPNGKGEAGKAQMAALKKAVAKAK